MTARSRIAAGAVVVALAIGITACDRDTVTVRYRPHADTASSYRYELRSTIDRRLRGEAPKATTTESRISTRQLVTSATPDQFRLRIIVRRDAQAARTYTVRFDRSAELVGVDLVDGVPADVVDTAGIADVFSRTVGAPPERPLAPGDTWPIDTTVTPAGDQEVTATGMGRLTELGVIGAERIATVDSTFDLPVHSALDNGRTALDGTQHVKLRVSYVLDDGSVVSSRSTVTGIVKVHIEPPLGVVGQPVEGWFRYRIETSGQRR